MAFAAARMILKDKRRKASKEDFAPRNRSKVKIARDYARQNELFRHHSPRVAFPLIEGRPREFISREFCDSRAEGSFNRIFMIFIARISTGSRFDWHCDRIVNLEARRLLKRVIFFYFQKIQIERNLKMVWIIYEKRKKKEGANAIVTSTKLK